MRCIASPALNVKHAKLLHPQESAAAKAIQTRNHNCGQKMYNLPSRATRQREMNVACGRITNYPSSVARQPLWRMIMVCDHNNTTQASYGTRTLVLTMNKTKQIMRANLVIAFSTQANRVAKHCFILRNQST